MTDSVAAPELRELREEIARIDHAIVLLVAARLRAARRAIRLRVLTGDEVSNPSQEFRVIDRAREWANEVALPPHLAERLMQTLVNAGKSWTEPPLEDLPRLPETIRCQLHREPGELSSPGVALDPGPRIVHPRGRASEALRSGQPVL